MTDLRRAIFPHAISLLMLASCASVPGSGSERGGDGADAAMARSPASDGSTAEALDERFLPTLILFEAFARENVMNGKTPEARLLSNKWRSENPSLVQPAGAIREAFHSLACQNGASCELKVSRGSGEARHAAEVLATTFALSAVQRSLLLRVLEIEADSASSTAKSAPVDAIRVLASLGFVDSREIRALQGARSRGPASTKPLSALERRTDLRVMTKALRDVWSVSRHLSPEQKDRIRKVIEPTEAMLR